MANQDRVVRRVTLSDQKKTNKSSTKSTRESNRTHIEILKSGAKAWNKWRSENDKIIPNLDNLELDYFDLQSYELSNASFFGASLTNVWFKGATLNNAPFCAAELLGCELEETECMDVKFNDAYLNGVSFDNACINGADFTGATLEEVFLEQVDLTEVVFDRTTLTNVRYPEDKPYPAMTDGSDSILITRRDRWLNWSKLRAIGLFPLFEVSWAGLMFSLVIINGVKFLNIHQPIDYYKYPIPIPESLSWVLLSSICLVIGSTLYRVACPDRIQTFSETQWVERHQNPRLLYLIDSWSYRSSRLFFLNWGGWRRFSQWHTLIFTILGGFLALWLAIKSIATALIYLYVPFDVSWA